MPEPNSKGRQVLVGDVGFVKEGVFYPLFNSLPSRYNLTDEENDTPMGFKALIHQHLVLEPLDKITQEMVCSRSIHAREVQADVAAAR